MFFATLSSGTRFGSHNPDRFSAMPPSPSPDNAARGDPASAGGTHVTYNIVAIVQISSIIIIVLLGTTCVLWVYPPANQLAEWATCLSLATRVYIGIERDVRPSIPFCTHRGQFLIWAKNSPTPRSGVTKCSHSKSVVGQGSGNLIDHALPISPSALAEQSHRRIPRTIASPGQPSPIRRHRQQHPNWLPHRPGQMCHRRIHRNNQIQFMLTKRGCIYQKSFSSRREVDQFPSLRLRPQPIPSANCKKLTLGISDSGD